MVVRRSPSGSQTGAATYVFCLVQSARRPSLTGVPESLPGAGAPRLLPIGEDVWAVVADAPVERFAPEHLENDLQDIEAISRHALAHAAVIEFFFRRAPVIPLKLFTFFSADARVLEHLARRRPRLRSLFAKLRGLEEWGVRVIARAVDAESTASLRSGTDYLEAKQRLTAENAKPSRTTIKETSAALKTLARLASKVRKERFPPPARGRPFVTGASFLVKSKRRQRWEKEVARVSRTLAARGHRLELSGPWPPYHFVSK